MSLLEGITFDDVLLVPNYNGIRSRQDVSTRVTLGSLSFELPLVSSNMDTVTGSRMAARMAQLGGFGILHRFLSVEDNVAELRRCPDPSLVGVSIGVGDAGLERAEALIGAGARIICVDVAHGHAKSVNQTIRDLRAKYKDQVVLIAGNVATYAGADYLAAAGADAIKVGIGPGSVCTTRIKTGFGVPQLTALMTCKQVDRPLIADGGVRTPGDAVKALAAGAAMVMLGGMLAGCDETPGEIIEHPREDGGPPLKVKRFRGMASREAQEDFMGQMAEWKTAEGIAVEVPARGSVDEVVRDLMGGIRSGLTYAGATDIKELQRKAQFIRVSPATAQESGPHALSRGAHAIAVKK
jgi:IMP dehydrogenase